MKICLIHNFYTQYGGEDEVVSYMLNIFKKNYQVMGFFVYSNEIKNIYSKLKFIFGLTTYREIKRLKTTLKKEKPDIVHIHNVFPILTPRIYNIIKKMNIPIVQTVHNFRFFCPNGLLLYQNNKMCNDFNNPIRCIKGKCYRNSYLQTLLYCLHIGYIKKNNILKNIDAVVVLTEFMDKFIKNNTNQNVKTYVIPNGVSRIEKDTHKETTSNYYLYIGRLSKEKGIFTIIEAFKMLNVVLYIAGEGPIRKKMLNKLKSEKIQHIKYIGFINEKEKAEYISNARAIIVPSECYEQMPLAIIEAFSAGKPAIVSDIGGMPYLVVNGYNGFIFKMGDIDSLQNAVYNIDYMKKEEYQIMCNNAFNSWRTKYSTAVFEKSIKDLYKGIYEKQTV